MALQVHSDGWAQTGKCTICRQTHESDDYGHEIASGEGNIMPCLYLYADKYLYALLWCWDAWCSDLFSLLLLLGWWSEGCEACVMLPIQQTLLWWCSCSQISLSGVCQAFSPLHCRSQAGCWWLLFSLKWKDWKKKRAPLYWFFFFKHIYIFKVAFRF